MNPSSLLRVLVPVLLLGASCLVALPATAVPITYRLSGVGSGHLGSQAFSDAAFVFTGVGDTDAIAPIGGGVWVNPLLSLQVQVSGHGTAQGLHAVDFFVNNTSGGLGFLDELVGDIIDVLGPGVGDFDGVSAFGPLAVDVDYLAPFSTTAGEFLLAQGGARWCLRPSWRQPRCRRRPRPGWRSAPCWPWPGSGSADAGPPPRLRALPTARRSRKGAARGPVLQGHDGVARRPLARW